MFEAMQNFIQVVEAGSFSAASQVLNKNASSVARQIDKLEQQLGARLFNRSTRRLELTLAGQGFYQQSLDIMAAIEEAKHSVQQKCDEIKGQIAISAFDSYGRMRITPLLPRFCETYPQTQVALSLSNSVVDLYESHFDLAIRHGRPSDSNLIMRRLQIDTAKLVAAPEYLAKHPPIEHPDDLKQHNCLTLHRQRQHTYWYFQQEHHQHKIKVTGSLSACGGEPLIQWLKEGLGITLISEWIVADALASGELVEVLPDWQGQLNSNEAPSIYMVWTQAAAQKPAVRSMIEFLTEHLGSL
jgi:DNA-binding transcriptional LysR family regulator